MLSGAGDSLVGEPRSVSDGCDGESLAATRPPPDPSTAGAHARGCARTCSQAWAAAGECAAKGTKWLQPAVAFTVLQHSQQCARVQAAAHARRRGLRATRARVVGTSRKSRAARHAGGATAASSR